VREQAKHGQVAPTTTNIVFKTSTQLAAFTTFCGLVRVASATESQQFKP
jgi:hypothetical protein